MSVGYDIRIWEDNGWVRGKISNSILLDIIRHYFYTSSFSSTSPKWWLKKVTPFIYKMEANIDTVGVYIQ